MKRYFLGVLCALFAVAVTGCGNKNQIKCNASLSEAGMNLEAEIVADFDDNDKLTDATIVYDLKDSETAKQYCSLFKLMEDKEKGIEVECSGSKVTIKGYAKIDEAEDENDKSLIGATKEEFIKEMESSEEGKFTCKK